MKKVSKKEDLEEEEEEEKRKFIKCPNFVICGFISTQRELDYHNGICYICNKVFADKLFTKMISKCPCCERNTKDNNFEKLGVREYENFSFVCTTCFKICNFPKDA